MSALWPKVKVGEVFDVQLGKMLSPKAKTGEQYTYLGNFNVQWGKISFDKLNTMHFSDREKGKYALKKNDILMCEGGEIGRCAIWRNQQENCYYQKALHRLRALDENSITPYYFYAYMEHITSNNGLVKIVGETSIAHLTREKLRELKFPLPPIVIQGQIADILNVWNKSIDKIEILITAKEKQFKWMINMLVRRNCSHWQHYLARELFDSISSKGHLDEELLSVTQDRGVIPRNMLKGRVMSPAGSTAGYKLVEKGNFVISLRSFQGGLEYSDYRGIVSPAYTILAAKKEINTDFYRHFFKSYIFVEKYLSVAVVGIRDGKQINSKDFDTVKIPYPPIDEQVAIAKKLDTAQQEIELLKNTLEKYRLQKRGLMQKLLTGEWQVPLQPNEEILKEAKT